MNEVAVAHSGKITHDHGGIATAIVGGLIFTAWILGSHYGDATRDAARIEACQTAIPLPTFEDRADPVVVGNALDACMKAAR